MHMSSHTGFSLVELLVVIVLISTLLTVATLNFHDMQVKSNVESQVRNMATDINEIRLRALTMKQRHTIVLNKNSYTFQSYSTEEMPKCSGGVPAGVSIPGKPVTVVVNSLKKSSGSYYAGSCLNIGGDTIEIDARGMLVGSPATVFIDYPGKTASLDCLIIHTIRVNPGSTNGANCEYR
jgi:type IV fimbrial biogenesis protein FimT